MLEAAQATRPLEVDPARTQLFALFVEAYQAGLVRDEVPSNLTADGLCAALSTRWGLKDTVQDQSSRSPSSAEISWPDAIALVGDADVDGVDVRLGSLGRSSPGGKVNPPGNSIKELASEGLSAPSTFAAVAPDARSES